MAGFYGVNLLKKEENRRTSKILPSKQGKTRQATISSNKDLGTGCVHIRWRKKISRQNGVNWTGTPGY